SREQSFFDKGSYGEPRRWGGRGIFPYWRGPPAPPPGEARGGRGGGGGSRSIELANWNPLSLTLSPLLRRGERESTSGMVVVSSCAPTDGEPAPPLLRHAVDRRNNGA